MLDISKIYNFKLQDLSIDVTIDKSFQAENAEFKSDLNNTEEGMHCHALFELFFVGDDPLVVLNEMEPFVFKNCLVFIPPLFVHNSVRSNDYRMLFSYYIPKENKSSISKFADEFFNEDLPFCAKINGCQKVYIEEIAAQIQDSSFVSEEIITSLLKVFFYNIYKCNSDIEEKSNNQRYDSYFIAIDGIIKNYQNDIKLKSVADYLHLSTKQTSRIIKKYYKTTLSQLVIKKRLGVACALLENSDMAVSDIAEYINFPSESYFYSQFKKLYGTTPLKYRKMKRNVSD